MKHSYTSTESRTYTMTNLGNLCLFSNLITIPVQQCRSGLMLWEKAFFYWFQGYDLVKEDENLKSGQNFKKVENQI